MAFKKVWRLLIMENIFAGYGKVAEGKAFIGRKKLVEKYRNIFFTPGNKSNYSIVGLPRSGKTSFIKEVFRTVPDNLLYVYLSLNNFACYKDIWLVLFDTIKEKLDLMQKQYDDKIFQFYTQEKNTHLDLQKAALKIFSFLKSEGIETIIVLDEFDSAGTLFENKTENYGIFRTVFSEYSNIVGILISRKQLYTIEGKTPEGSTFSGIFSLDLFKGFSDEDLQEYYSVFSNEGYELTEETKKQIQYYAGALPYFLSIIGSLIIDRINLKQEIDIIDIFKKDCEKIRQEYDRIINYLKTDGNLYKLISIVLGPDIGITQDDIDELKSLGYLYDDVDSENYIGISKYFGDFLRWKNIRIDLHKSLEIVEVKIRELINKHEIDIFDDNGITNTKSSNDDKWRIVLSKIGLSKKAFDTYDDFIVKTRINSCPDAKYFDVISLGLSFKIIEHEWKIFERYFSKKSYNEWVPIFKNIAIIRNPIAHNHTNWISPHDIRLSEDECDEIIKSIESADNNGQAESINHSDIIDTNKIYSFKGESLNQNGGLRGKLDTGEDGVIPQKNYSSFMIPSSDLIGKELKVKILGKKPQGSGYICELVGIN